MAGVILSVQLLVYPAFSYYTKSGLDRWHRHVGPRRQRGRSHHRRVAAAVAQAVVGQVVVGLQSLVDVGHDGRLPLPAGAGVGAVEVDENGRRAIFYRRPDNSYGLYSDKSISLSI